MIDPRDVKRVRVLPAFALRMTEPEVEALVLECEATLREWSEERAQMLFSICEDETVVETHPDRV